MLAETLDRASRAGLSVATLGRLRDVDTLDDLRAEWPTLGPFVDRRPGLRAVIQRAFEGRPPQ